MVIYYQDPIGASAGNPDCRLQKQGVLYRELERYACLAHEGGLMRRISKNFAGNSANAYETSCARMSGYRPYLLFLPYGSIMDEPVR